MKGRNTTRANRLFRLGVLGALLAVIGFVSFGWLTPAEAQISTAFDLTGLGTRTPIEIALSLINWMLGILALIAVIFILYAGFLWLTSAGNEDRIEKAKEILISTLIGLLIILAAWGIVLYVLGILLDVTNGGTGGEGCTGSDCDSGNFPSSGSTFYVRSTDPYNEEQDVTLCTDVYVLFSKDIDTDSPTTSISGSPTVFLRLIDPSSFVDKAGAGQACAQHTDCSSASCDAASLTCNGDNVAGTIEIDDLDTVDGVTETTDHFSFLPSTDFQSNSVYEMTVLGGSSGVISEASIGSLTMDQDYTFTFTTGITTDVIPPVVEEVAGNSPFPTDNEVDVCLNTPINFQFSEAIRTYTVDDDASFLVSSDSTFIESGLVGLQSFDFGGNRDYAMTRPSAELTANSPYYGQLYGGDDDGLGGLADVITDSCGNPLDGDFDGASEGAVQGDGYFSSGYDFSGDGVSDEPLNWTTGENAECTPLIESIIPGNEYYGYGDNPSTALIEGDATDITVAGNFLAPNPEIIFNDTIYSSSGDLSCFDTDVPPDSSTICLLSSALAEDHTKVPVGSKDGELSVRVADENSECVYDADADGNVSCAFTVDSPHIDYIDPHESAPGDYVTIGGDKFGADEGSVYFRADDETVAAGYPEYVIAQLPEACGDTWNEESVVVVVPDEYPVDTALDVQLVTADGHWSNFTYFTVSDTERPSLCAIAPSCHDIPAQTSVITGQKLGSSGIVYYGDTAGSSSGWSATSITATSPSAIVDGDYYVTVSVDGQISNGVRYELPCTGDETSPGSSGEDSDFYVRATDPEDGEGDVTLCTDVYALFSQDINMSTLTTTTFFLQVQGGAVNGATCSDNADCASASCQGSTCAGGSVSGSIQFDPGAETDGTDHASFLPSTDFESNTTYAGTILGGSGGVKSSDGTEMDDVKVFLFETGTTTDVIPPTVVENSYSPTPPDGGTDICLNTPVAFQFSEAMRTYTFDESTSFLVASASDFISSSLVNLRSFDFGADRISATTRPSVALAENTEHYTRLYGGDVQDDGSYTNVVTDACGNPLDGDFDGAVEGAHTDDYLAAADTDQPINWTTGTTYECTPEITNISPTRGYYGVEGANDFITISGRNLSPFPQITFEDTMYVSLGEETCFDTDTPPDIAAECLDVDSSGDTSIVTKIPVSSRTGGISVEVADERSDCLFDEDGNGATNCDVTVDSPYLSAVSPEDAAPGDYITLQGLNFGSSTGAVYFRSADGINVLAEFPPDSCGDTWTDTQIIVIVPDDFAVGTALDIQVQTSEINGSHFSNPQDFSISDADRPSVCSIAPSCHDTAGQTSTITGQKFGDSGTVAYGIADGSPSSWGDTSIVVASPSTLSQQAYAVGVTDSAGQTSNTVEYEIPCDEAPQVVEINSCDASSGVYPTPNPTPGEEEACVNSNIGVVFDQVMDTTSFTTSTIRVVECNTVPNGDGTNTFSSSSCDAVNMVDTSEIDEEAIFEYGDESYYGFILDLEDLTASAWYQVTVTAGVRSEGGVPLSEEYSYHFLVRDDAADCEYSGIQIQPDSITHGAYSSDTDGDGVAESPRGDGDYQGNPYSDECLLLDSDAFSWSWTLANPTGGDCTDADSDGLSISQETAAGTNVGDSDSDDDTFEDGWEVESGTNPLDPTSVPTSSVNLSADDICTDTEICQANADGTSTCVSLVGDFSSSGAGLTSYNGGDQVTVYPGGNDNYNQGIASLIAQVLSLSDTATYTVDLGYCEQDADCEQVCAGSTCDESISRCTPVVSNFSPTSGALGTWVTINGCFFGPEKGNVEWVDGNTVIDTAWPNEALCGDTWTDSQIIAEFPETYIPDDASSPVTPATSSYAIQVTSSYDLQTTTADEFQVDTNVRPGLCRVEPDSEIEGGGVELFGQNFNESEGSVSFNGDTSRVLASAGDTTWSDTQLQTVVPGGAVSGISASGQEGVQVILADNTTESNAMDFMVTYTAPYVVSTQPEDGEAGVCPNGIITATFSEDMSNVVAGSGGTIHLYRVADDGSGGETETPVILASATYSDREVTITPRASLNTSSAYRLRLDSADSSDIIGVNSQQNLDGGTYNLDFETGAVICTPDHVELTLSANELEENLDLDASGTIDDMPVDVSSWTYKAEGESRQWTAHMYDQNDQELVNVANMSWVWTWEPLYDETACVNAIWVSTVEGDTDFDQIQDEREIAIGTDPEVYDTDGDVYGDNWEIEQGTDPLDNASYPNAADYDNDGLLASEELEWNTDATEYDSDGDGHADGWEVYNGFDPIDPAVYPTTTMSTPDTDSDGLLEVASSTALEETAAGTSSTLQDTDGDTFLDGWEVLYGSNASDVSSVPGLSDPGIDVDGDGLGVNEETAEGTTSTAYDTDSDGYGDGWELENASDPLDPASFPTTQDQLTTTSDIQSVVAGNQDDETASLTVTAEANTGWTGSETTSASLSVHFCEGDLWQFNDDSQRIQTSYCDSSHSLPTLTGPATTTSSEYLLQYLFPSADDANDTVGIRVYENSTDFLTPEAWVLANVPDAASLSLSSTDIDGYPAVRSSNAIYISATYVASSSYNYRLYNNIYLITWTEGGYAEQLADQMIENWGFNTNVDTSNDTISSPDEGCEYSSKSKLQRDTERMIELNTLSTELEEQYTADSIYPFPRSDSVSSYLDNITNSVWPSWQGGLGNVLGEALVEDPINKFVDDRDADDVAVADYLDGEATVDCPYSPDTNEFFDTSGTCWDNVNLIFNCPDNSFVYLYKVDETDQTDAWVYGHMEYEPTIMMRFYPTGQYNTYKTSSTNYSGICSSPSDCSCFNFAMSSEAGASFLGGE